MDERYRFSSAGEFYSAESDADVGSPPLDSSNNERFLPSELFLFSVFHILNFLYGIFTEIYYMSHF